MDEDKKKKLFLILILLCLIILVVLGFYSLSYFQKESLNRKEWDCQKKGQDFYKERQKEIKEKYDETDPLFITLLDGPSYRYDNKRDTCLYLESDLTLSKTEYKASLENMCIKDLKTNECIVSFNNSSISEESMSEDAKKKKDEERKDFMNRAEELMGKF